LPEKEYERRELKQAVQRAIDKLDPDQRAVVVLVDLQDFDYQEAAQILGIPIGTVRSRLARARLRLRSLLASTNYWYNLEIKK
jgi:RNA polymerase sigma-70 factor (ECF subfamily)